ncbi:MAG: hypothetical protein ACRC7C_03955, partial [Beijerinckiaceae bacterium]
MSLALEGPRASAVPQRPSRTAVPKRFFVRLCRIVSSPRFVAVAGVLAFWEAAVRWFELPLWYLPPPSHIAHKVVTNFH